MKVDHVDHFFEQLTACPLVAIVRGIHPGEAEEVVAALVDVGIRIIEVPLNSPEPFNSIERLATRFGGNVTIGAGTVLDPADVSRVQDAGGRLIVSPDTNPEVIAATASAGLVSAPGFFTPTEAFQALRAGAHVLKMFPAEAASPAFLKAQRAVLPADLPILMVGGVTPAGVADYLAAGANGFGLGSGLFSPGRTVAEVTARGRAYVEALTQCKVR
ncbi:2-dehydro-3-deoxy-6-phosphogalactonate aldolase [Sphingomonas sp. CARO-RG-8B-R24-01]|uniref:2-dehydro-3-deoxy-6-phosphogalactonate aldolase n=1 Tax=Sphingomonas sp. CARO-RG-8B-R24-01 TaxID=2914831 RepID=UPI001F5A75CA|nr:2-dehydro-3-deoxy-6-phosphogalactonate aldolase [Sphingomonas sp. CARO-RG-8B-R24-01]